MRRTRTIQAVGKKLKGKLQQAQGNLQQQSGQGFKGGIQKLKGKANEFIADTQLRSKSRRVNSDY